MKQFQLREEKRKLIEGLERTKGEEIRQMKRMKAELEKQCIEEKIGKIQELEMMES